LFLVEIFARARSVSMPKLIEIVDPKTFTDEEICARCGQAGSYHRPPATYSYAKTGASSGNSREVPITARTCNWSHPLTTCVAFAREERKMKMITNSYAQAFGRLYAKTPKAVFAAVAFSFAGWACGQEAKTDAEQVQRFVDEWARLTPERHSSTKTMTIVHVSKFRS
jgi:hypothetical protein